jgi:hypothetical protein
MLFSMGRLRRQGAGRLCLLGMLAWAGHQARAGRDVSPTPPRWSSVEARVVERVDGVQIELRARPLRVGRGTTLVVDLLANSADETIRCLEDDPLVIGGAVDLARARRPNATGELAWGPVRVRRGAPERPLCVAPQRPLRLRRVASLVLRGRGALDVWVDVRGLPSGIAHFRLMRDRGIRVAAMPP